MSRYTRRYWWWKQTTFNIRNDEDEILLEGIPDDILDSIKEADVLMVCELIVGEKEEDTQIAYAYEAEIDA